MAEDGWISGYAAVFNSETEIGGQFRERLARGCFDRTLREQPDVIALLAHDMGRVLGRTTAGTLELKTDRIGLFFRLKCDLTTPSGQEAFGTVNRRDVKGCSFAGIFREEEWSDNGRDLPLRTVTDIDLYEITLTAFPAYDDTLVDVVRTAPDRARLKAEAAMKARGIPLI